MAPGAGWARVATALLAGAVVCAGYVVLAGLAYVALLAVALATVRDAGGPLGGPLLLVVGALVGLACVLVVWVATVLGAVAARTLRVPGPAVSAGLALAVAVAAALLDAARDVVPGVPAALVAPVVVLVIAPAWVGLTGADRAVLAGASWVRARRRRNALAAR